MAPVALPLLKLGTLFVKQIAKPLASNLKLYSKTNTHLSKVCSQIGQFNHTISSKISVMSLGHKIKSIKPLADQEAIDSGANFLGEGFIYSVSAAIICYEFIRSNRDKEIAALKKLEKRKLKEEKLKDLVGSLETKIEDLNNDLNDIKKEFIIVKRKDVDLYETSSFFNSATVKLQYFLIPTVAAITIFLVNKK